MRRGRFYDWRDRYSRQPTGGGGGFAAWPSLIGAEMMVNGDCSSATGWGLPAGSAIAVGKMTLTAFTDVIENTGVTDTLINGATYRCVFTVDTVSLGAVRWVLGSTAGTSRSTTGTFSQDILSTDVSGVVEGIGATMQLDNFSVKSVGLVGIETDWSLSGSLAWIDGPPAGFSFGDGDESTIASLTGSALTAFAASVSFNTACLLRVYGLNYSNGDISARIHQGSWVPLNVSADGWSTPVAITSGSVVGFEVRGNADGNANVTVVGVQIELA